MKPVQQTRFEAGSGNCLNACVASILALPLGGEGGVPEEKDELRFWLAHLDLGIVWCDRNAAISLAGLGSYHLAAGVSPRDPEREHAIVMCEERPVHDPHPSGSFLVGAPRQLGWLVRLGLGNEEFLS